MTGAGEQRRGSRYCPLKIRDHTEVGAHRGANSNNAAQLVGKQHVYARTQMRPVLFSGPDGEYCIGALATTAQMAGK